MAYLHSFLEGIFQIYCVIQEIYGKFAKFSRNLLLIKSVIFTDRYFME